MSFQNQPKCPNYSCDDDGEPFESKGVTWLKCSKCDNITKRDPADCSHAGQDDPVFTNDRGSLETSGAFINECKNGANAGKFFKKCKQCKEFLGFCSKEGVLAKPIQPFKKKRAAGGQAVSSVDTVPRAEFDMLCARVLELDQKVTSISEKVVEMHLAFGTKD